MDSSIHPNALAAAIEQWQSNVLDSDIVVDDSRADLQRALEAYRSAVRERQRAVDHLTHLIGCAPLEAA